MATINSINSNIPIEISKGGTNATSMATTDGVVYFDSSKLVTTAAGTSGNVLTSNGAGVAPTYQAAPTGGSLRFIQSQSGTGGASLVFNTGLSYTNYVLLFYGATGTNAGGDVQLNLQFSTDGGGTYLTSGYLSGLNRYITNSTTNQNNNDSASILLLEGMGNNVKFNVGAVFIFGIGVSGNPSALVQGFGQYNAEASNSIIFGGGVYNSTATATSFKLFVNSASGVISTGTFVLYGLATS